MIYRTRERLGLLDPMASTPGTKTYTVPNSSFVLGMGHPGWSFTLNIGICIFHLTVDGLCIWWWFLLSVYSFEHVHLNKQALHCFPRNLTQGFTCNSANALWLGHTHSLSKWCLSFCWWYWFSEERNLGPCSCQSSTLPLSHSSVLKCAFYLMLSGR